MKKRQKQRNTQEQQKQQNNTRDKEKQRKGNNKTPKNNTNSEQKTNTGRKLTPRKPKLASQLISHDPDEEQITASYNERGNQGGDHRQNMTTGKYIHIRYGSISKWGMRNKLLLHAKDKAK